MRNSFQLIRNALVLLIISFFLPGKGLSKNKNGTINDRIIKVSVSPSVLHAGDDMTLSFHIDDASSVYYFGINMVFDDQIASFISSAYGPLMGNQSLHIAHVIAPDTVRASVTRTAGTATGNGVLFTMTFHIAEDASPGLLNFKIRKIDLKDSTGQSIQATWQNRIDSTITASISDARLLFHQDTLTVGNQTMILAEVKALSITDQKGVGNGIKAWIGISASDTDPSTWSDTAWTAATYQKDDGSYDQYGVQIGNRLSSGTYYIATRFQLNNQDYVYGGYRSSGGGIWDGKSNTSSILVIKKKAPYRTQLVVWNFNDDNLIADRGVRANLNDTLQLFGAQLDGWTSGVEGDALNSNRWDDSTRSEYYMVHLTTEYYKDLELYSKQRGSSSGPRDFVVEYSLDRKSWNPVSSSHITVSNDWNGGVLTGVQMPAIVSNQKNLYLRWRKTTQIRVDGDTTIYNLGTDRLDDIMITGVDMNPTTVKVWPGDTNNDGKVDQTDVLPLGENWMISGPARQDSTLNWTQKEAISWRPADVSYADADGNGMINEEDLFPIGINYGKSHQVQSKVTARSQKYITFSDWPEIKPGDHLNIMIKTKRPIDIQGLSCRFIWQHADTSSFTIEEPKTGKWADNWQEKRQILKFMRINEGSGAVAWVHEGATHPVSSSTLFTIGLKIKDRSFRNTQFQIKELAILNDHIQSISSDSIKIAVTVDHPTAIDKQAQVIHKTRLDKNYPNPFNPTTNIRYELAHRGMVRLAVYNILGRKVSELVDKIQSSGRYTITWQARQSASGIYFYRLRANGKVFTRKMVLVK